MKRHLESKLLGRLVLRVAMLLAASAPAATAHAAPSQQDVFKSISNNVNDSVDGKKVLAVASAIGGGFCLIAFFTRKKNTARRPGPTNHHGKLTKELCKATGLKPGQLRQLKVMADSLADKGRPVDSPLTLLLCPSLIKRARGDDR